MATVLNDEVMVCTDCLMIIANGDASGLDYHYSQAEAAKRLADIEVGINAMQGKDGHLFAGDSEKDEEFSRSSCDCCGESLAGSRHHCVLLGG